jgi:single-strand DNA-binding protein
MADVNHVILIGRLTRDAELKYTSGGMAVCKFALAVNKRRKQGEQWIEEANFFDVVAWGKTGESLNQYLVKGKQVAVEGELHQNRWEQDGQSRSKIEINANNIQLLGGDRPQSAGSPPPSAAPASRPPSSMPPIDDDVPPDFPEDIPFNGDR